MWIDVDYNSTTTAAAVVAAEDNNDDDNGRSFFCARAWDKEGDEETD